MKRNADIEGVDGFDGFEKKARNLEDRPLGFSEFRFVIEKKHQGLLIGKGGTKISSVREESGVNASILKVADNSVHERILVLQGTVEQCAHAWKLFGDVVNSFQQEQEMKANIEVPNSLVTIKVLCDKTQIGSIIGKGGATIRQTQADTGARIQVSNDCLPGCTEKTVNLTATTDILQTALLVTLTQLRDYPVRPGTSVVQYAPGMASAASTPFSNPYAPYGGLGATPQAQADPYAQYGMSQFGAAPAPPKGQSHTQKIVIPTVCAGGVIGKGGSRIREMQAQSGCTIRLADATAEMPAERVVTLEGSDEGIQFAIQLIRHAVEQSSAASVGVPPVTSQQSYQQ